MKYLNFIVTCCLLVATIALPVRSEGLFAATAHPAEKITMPNDPDCRKLKAAIEKAKKALDKLNAPAGPDDPTPLEELEEGVSDARNALEDWERDTDRHDEAGKVREKHNELKDKLDDARTALDDFLQKIDKALAELQAARRKYLEECDDKLSERDKNKLEQELDDDDSRKEEYKDRGEKNRGEALLEEWRRLQREQRKTEAERKKEDPDAEGEESEEDFRDRLEKKLEKRDDETEREYRSRLRRLREKYPWLEPEKEPRERDRDFRDRTKRWKERQKSKWEKDFWKKIQDEIRKKIEDLIRESEEREKEEKESDDQGSLPGGDRRENYLALGGGMDWLPPVILVGNDPVSGRIEHAVFSNPMLMERLFERLGSEFWPAEDPTLSPPVADHLPTTNYALELLYGFRNFLEFGLTGRYARGEKDLPFSMNYLQPSGSGETDRVLGTYSHAWQSTRITGRAGLAVGKGNFRFLIGPQLTAAATRVEERVRLLDLGWDLEPVRDFRLLPGVYTGLRWQLPADLYLTLGGEGFRDEGQTHWGAGVRLGIIMR